MLSLEWKDGWQDVVCGDSQGNSYSMDGHLDGDLEVKCTGGLILAAPLVDAYWFLQ